MERPWYQETVESVALFRMLEPQRPEQGTKETFFAWKPAEVKKADIYC